MGTDTTGIVVWETSGLGRLVVWETSGLVWETSGQRLVHYRQTVIQWANKWYQSRTSAVANLTDGDDRRF